MTLSFTITLLCLLANGPTQRIDSGEIWRVDIQASEESIQRLRTEPRGKVAAKISVGGKPEGEVSVRLKGRGTFETIDQKPSFTIFASNAEPPFGVEKFHLNNSAEDPTFLREMVGAEIFAAGGVPVPRVGHAQVFLNGKSLGLYVLKEGFTAEFLERYFGKPIGILYDTDDANDVDRPLEVDLGDQTVAREKLAALEAAAAEEDLALRLEKFHSLLEVESFLKFLALEILTCHWDGYGLSQNNYRLYYGGAPARFHFLPTGMDQVFAKPDFPWNPTMGGLVARSILETEAGRSMFREQLQSLLTATLDAGQLSNRISNLRTKLQRSVSRSDYASFRQHTEELAMNVSRRAAFLEKELSAAPLAPLQFHDGKAILDRWLPFDQPVGGNLASNAFGLTIKAGPKTSASWKCKVRLEPGTYILRVGAFTRDVVSLPFGNRHGARLRVLGKGSESRSILGTTDEVLQCNVEVTHSEEVTIVCELRASKGEVIFKFPITLEQ